MYLPNPHRYDSMVYRTVPGSGVKLPIISLGFWHNFGNENTYEKVKEMVLWAFDHGITHFDLANNYGLPGGSAEAHLGKILSEELKDYRDELFISTKAGFRMWNGPYGDGGSRKYLLSSLDQSLKRLNIPYVDLFYSHRFDDQTPLEETILALVDAVRMGKALYVGLSNYPTQELKKAVAILKSHGIHPLLFQPHFSALDTWARDEGAFDVCAEEKFGVIPYSIFNQGLLTGKYLREIPKDSRMARPDNPFLTEKSLNVSLLNRLTKLNEYCESIHRSMTEVALHYVLGQRPVSSALVGVSRLEQLQELTNAALQEPLNMAQLDQIDSILKEKS